MAGLQDKRNTFSINIYISDVLLTHTHYSCVVRSKDTQMFWSQSGLFGFQAAERLNCHAQSELVEHVHGETCQHTWQTILPVGSS